MMFPGRRARGRPATGRGSSGGVHPTIVDVDVLVADVGHPGADHHVGRLADQLVGDPVVVCVPMVPAHRRGQRQQSPLTIFSGRDARPWRVLRVQHERIGAALGSRAAEDAGGRVELQTGRQILRGELHRPAAGGWNAVKERMPGAAAVDLRSVYSWCRSGLGRENQFGSAHKRQFRRPGTLRSPTEQQWQAPLGISAPRAAAAARMQKPESSNAVAESRKRG